MDHNLSAAAQLSPPAIPRRVVSTGIPPNLPVSAGQIPSGKLPTTGAARRAAAGLGCKIFLPPALRVAQGAHLCAKSLMCRSAPKIDPRLHQEPMTYTRNRRRSRVKCACRFRSWGATESPIANPATTRSMIRRNTPTTGRSSLIS